MTDLPARKPARPYFSSGPCAKPPGWDPAKLATEVLGRSHRSKLGKARLQYCIDLIRDVLEVPETHCIDIVPASDTGAVEMAMWSMLGERNVDVCHWCVRRRSAACVPRALTGRWRVWAGSRSARGGSVTRRPTSS